jgi:hypothetical protein
MPQATMRLPQGSSQCPIRSSPYALSASTMTCSRSQAFVSVGSWLRFSAAWKHPLVLEPWAPVDVSITTYHIFFCNRGESWHWTRRATPGLVVFKVLVAGRLVAAQCHHRYSCATCSVGGLSFAHIHSFFVIQGSKTQA